MQCSHLAFPMTRYHLSKVPVIDNHRRSSNPEMSTWKVRPFCKESLVLQNLTWMTSFSTYLLSLVKLVTFKISIHYISCLVLWVLHKVGQIFYPKTHAHPITFPFCTLPVVSDLSQTWNPLQRWPRALGAGTIVRKSDHHPLSRSGCSFCSVPALFPLLNSGWSHNPWQLSSLLFLKVLSGGVFLVVEVTLSLLDKKAACREAVLLIHCIRFFMLSRWELQPTHVFSKLNWRNGWQNARGSSPWFVM